MNRGTVILGLLAVAFAVPMHAEESGGAATFKQKCTLCHGADGTGQTTLGKQLQAANLHSKDVQKRSDAELHKIIHDGNGNMPPFGDQLTDEQIDAVIKHVRTFGKSASAAKK